MRAEFRSWSVSKRVLVFGALGVFFGWLLFRPFSTDLLEGRSLAGWTWLACNSKNGFLHGRLVPLIFPWMVWWWYRVRRDEEIKPSYWGLVWLVLGMLLYWAGVRTIRPRWALFGLPFFMVGLAQYCLGGKMARGLAPAAFFLWFMIPVPGLEVFLTGWMHSGVIEATAVVSEWIGIDLIREGWGFVVRDSRLSFQAGIGIRYFNWTVMIGAVMAIFYQAPVVKRWTLFLISIPLVVVPEVLFNVIILKLVSMGREDWARNFFFDHRGAFKFVTTVLFLLVAAWVMNRIRAPRWLRGGE